MEPAPRDPTATAILPELLNLTSVPAGGLAGKLPPQSIRVAQRTTATLLGGPMVARVFRRRADADLHRGE
jgi:hypothetical protein